jgi:hypothetical protein
MTRFAIGKPGVLFRRFAPAIVAAYLMHWGVWALLFVVDQMVLWALTATVDWSALLLGQFSAVERETVLLRPLPGELAEGIVPLILGLLVGWWLRRRRRGTQQHPLQRSESK